ncbi:hypothetical protein REPUB_Repub11eG0064000 [Reevesia pubescens]
MDAKATNNLITTLPEDVMNCSKLTKLDVEGNKLTTLSKNLFASWTMLTKLNASKNLLNGIPENIGCLSRLIRLYLRQNNENNALPMLLEELGALSRLGTLDLDLHSNQLKEYPVGACKLSLSVLDLSNNSLTGLPAELGKFTGFWTYTCFIEIS